MFNGWKRWEVLWLAIASALVGGALVSLPDIWSWALTPEGSYAGVWLQGVGTVIAVAVALWAPMRQHKRDRHKAATELLEKKIALNKGALQLIGAVQRISEKLSADLVAPVGITTQKLGVSKIELNGAVNALSRVDHLQFDTHALIESLLVAESTGSALRDELFKSGSVSIPTLIQRTGDCNSELKPRIEKIYKKITADERVVADMRKRTH